MSVIKPGSKLVQPFVYQAQQLPIHLPVIQYIRQSTEGQVKHNKQSTILQDTQFAGRLRAMGFMTLKQIATDQGKSGQVIKGTKMVKRKGLDELYQLVEVGYEGLPIGAIAAFSPSRLYRDLTREFYTHFVRMLETRHIPLITWQRIYWPDSRADMDALIDKFAEAARFIEEEIHGKLIPAKLQAIEDDASYGGGCVPLGYIVLGEKGERKYYQIYEPHAKLVRWLFKRYRALNGSLGKLGHELRAMHFAFPPFEDVQKIPHVGLRYVEGRGYPLRTRGSLVSILTNTAYIGWYVFNGVLISKEAHDAIVGMDDFLYAYSRLSPVDLDGNPYEHKPKVERHWTEKSALLDGVLTSDNNPVYVSNNQYTAKTVADGWHSAYLMVPVELIDRAFSKVLMAKLHALDELKKSGLQDDLRTQLTKLAAEKTQEVISLDDSLVKIDKAIAGWQLDKESCRDTGNKTGLDEANRQLKILYDAQSVLLAQVQVTKREKEALQKAKTLHKRAVDDWASLAMQQQQSFIKLLVPYANMVELSPHIIRLDILLRNPFIFTHLTGYLYRQDGACAKWTPDEEAAIRRLYPQADRAVILEALPDRAWLSIRTRASRMGVKRLVDTNSSTIADTVTYSDTMVMAELERGSLPIKLTPNGAAWRPGQLIPGSQIDKIRQKAFDQEIMEVLKDVPLS